MKYYSALKINELSIPWKTWRSPKFIFFKWKVKLLSRTHFVTPSIVTYQAPLTMGFFSKNTGVSCHLLLRGIFLTQGSNLGFLHCRQTLYYLSHQGSPLSEKVNLKIIYITIWFYLCYWRSFNYEDRKNNNFPELGRG